MVSTYKTPSLPFIDFNRKTSKSILLLCITLNKGLNTVLAKSHAFPFDLYRESIPLNKNYKLHETYVTCSPNKVKLLKNKYLYQHHKQYTLLSLTIVMDHRHNFLPRLLSDIFPFLSEAVRMLRHKTRT